MIEKEELQEELQEEMHIANAKNEANVFAVRLRNGLGERMKNDIEHPSKEFVNAIKKVQRRERFKRFLKKIFH